MFNKHKTFLAICLVLSYLILPLILADEDTSGGFNSVRLENEYKLDIPAKNLEEVYNYLLEKYKSPEWLSPELSMSLLEEKFVDIYFDTSKLEIYDKWAGVRYRTRYQNKEEVKQLIQIKVTLNKTDLTRQEIKFPVNSNINSKKDLRNDPLISHPFFGLVEPHYREDVYNLISSMNIEPSKLKPMLEVTENRRRIYLNNPQGVLITITLDEVTGQKSLFKTKYYELELELNEIQYTSSDSAGRERLNKLTKTIYQDLIQKFPDIKQDQEPKYEKTLDNLQKKFFLLKFLIRIGLI